MKSSPSDDPHPCRGWLRGKEGEEEREGLKGGVKEETFSEAVCLLYVATKLSYCIPPETHLDTV